MDFADRAGKPTAIRKTQLEISSLVEVAYAGASARPWHGSDRINRREGARLKRTHLVWADKVGLVTAFVIAVLSALVCAAVLVAADTVTFSRLNHALAVWSGVAELTIALPIWLLMRGIDFATDGPARRARCAADQQVYGRKCST
jgi:hypothetical protein